MRCWRSRTGWRSCTSRWEPGRGCADTARKGAQLGITGRLCLVLAQLLTWFVEVFRPLVAATPAGALVHAWRHGTLACCHARVLLPAVQRLDPDALLGRHKRRKDKEERMRSVLEGEPRALVLLVLLNAIMQVSSAYQACPSYRRASATQNRSHPLHQCVTCGSFVGLSCRPRGPGVWRQVQPGKEQDGRAEQPGEGQAEAAAHGCAVRPGAFP
jgi:hypothetical protein